MERRARSPRKSTEFVRRSELSSDRLTASPNDGLARSLAHLIASPKPQETPANFRDLVGATAADRGASTHSQRKLFRSFFAAGFECSTHVRRSGHRLDLIEATAHDRFA